MKKYHLYQKEKTGRDNIKDFSSCLEKSKNKKNAHEGEWFISRGISKRGAENFEIYMGEIPYVSCVENKLFLGFKKITNLDKVILRKILNSCEVLQEFNPLIVARVL